MLVPHTSGGKPGLPNTISPFSAWPPGLCVPAHPAESGVPSEGRKALLVRVWRANLRYQPLVVDGLSGHVTPVRPPNTANELCLVLFAAGWQPGGFVPVRKAPPGHALITTSHQLPACAIVMGSVCGWAGHPPRSAPPGNLAPPPLAFRSVPSFVFVPGTTAG